MLQILVNTHFDFVRWRRWAYLISGVAIALSLAHIAYQGGLRYGIDFAGGTLMQIRFEQPITVDALRQALGRVQAGESVIQEFGDAQEYLIRVPVGSGSLDEVSKRVDGGLRQAGLPGFEVRRLEFVGPQVGRDLQWDAVQAVLWGMVGILVYTAFRFDFKGGVAAILARRLGRLEQAIAIGEYLVARDPANSFLHTDLGFAYRYAGRLDAAIGECRTVLSLSPGYMWSHRTIGDILLQQGDTKAALAEMQQEPDEQARLTGLSMAYHALGRENESDASLAHAIEKYEKTSAHPIAVALAFRGETDRAFGWLEKAVQYNDTDLGATALQPMFAPLHSDPRWLPLLRKIGMAPEQLAAIKFDVTVPR